MELNVMIQNHTSLDFFNMNTNTTCSSPYISAPSSPTQKPLNFFYSAPSSPSKFSQISDHNGVGDHKFEEVQDDGFEFEFSGQLDMRVIPPLSSADELFDGGKIRPLKPPSVMISTVDHHHPSPMSKFKEALSPKHRRNKNCNDNDNNDQSRGRSKYLSTPRANSRKGISRSLSPLRVTEFAIHQQELVRENNNQISSNNGANSSRWGSSKWRLKDFLLFRSASEGSATTNGKDPLRNNKKYLSILSSKKRSDTDNNEGSFTSNEGSVSRRRGTQVSAHERHYMKNRLVSEEQKKKTSLAYKPGFMACLGFNPALYDLTKAFGSFNYP